MNLKTAILLATFPLLAACASAPEAKRRTPAHHVFKGAPAPRVHRPVGAPKKSARQIHEDVVKDRSKFASRQQEDRLKDPHRYLMVGSVTAIYTPQHFDFETAGIAYRVKLAGTRGLFNAMPKIHLGDPFAKKIMHWLKKRLLNREIHIVFDPGAVKQDRYSQIVCYVFYQPDNSKEWKFLNLEIMEEGYAVYKKIPGWIHDQELYLAERRARFGLKGVWGEAARREEKRLRKLGEPKLGDASDAQP